jgi:hypothetical protein
MATIEKRLTGKKLKSTSMTLKFLPSEEKNIAVTEDVMPVIVNGNRKINFNESVYWKNLSTKRLGNTVFYTEVISTTMTVLER